MPRGIWPPLFSNPPTGKRPGRSVLSASEVSGLLARTAYSPSTSVPAFVAREERERKQAEAMRRFGHDPEEEQR